MLQDEGRDLSMQRDTGIYMLFYIALRLCSFLEYLEMGPAWEKIFKNSIFQNFVKFTFQNFIPIYF